MSRTQSVALVVACVVVLGAPLHAMQYVVAQKDQTFSTARLTVRVGDGVVFKNSDNVTHNVFSSTKGREFSGRAQAPGGATEVVLKTEGIIEVNCAFHPKMKLIITVKR